MFVVVVGLKMRFVTERLEAEEVVGVVGDRKKVVSSRGWRIHIINLL
jgi:predicted LPLAT superfamily acyltransferase